MQKFTIFSAILTIVIIVIVAEIVVSDYLPNWKDGSGAAFMEFSLPDSLDEGGADTAPRNYLGADLDYDEIVDETALTTGSDLVEEVFTLDPQDLQANTLYDFSSDAPSADFEDVNYVSFSPNVYIRDEQLKSAGFSTAYAETQSNDGYLYKTIYVADFPGTTLKKSIIRDQNVLYAKVYVFTFDPGTTAEEIYGILKIRAAEGLGIDINETNSFGSESFYMNDSARQSIAFLTVRVNHLIYAFSYPKEYHSQISNLIQLLEMEFL